MTAKYLIAALIALPLLSGCESYSPSKQDIGMATGAILGGVLGHQIESEGGYAEAFARVGFLLAGTDEPIPLSLLTTAQDLIRDYANLLPPLPVEQWHRIRGEQEIVRYDPERALATLPRLLDDAEREHLVALIERVVTDKRVLARPPTPQQAAMLERVRKALGGKKEAAVALSMVPVRKARAKALT
ncbi:MAG: hypothetical protein ACXWUU_14410 [Burkholderiales bacterium]